MVLVQQTCKHSGSGNSQKEEGKKENIIRPSDRVSP